jgi:hypothetical protein
MKTQGGQKRGGWRGRAERWALAALFVFLFAAGYGSMSSVVNSCRAEMELQPWYPKASDKNPLQGKLFAPLLVTNEGSDEGRYTKDTDVNIAEDIKKADNSNTSIGGTSVGSNTSAMGGGATDAWLYNPGLKILTADNIMSFFLNTTMTCPCNPSLITPPWPSLCDYAGDHDKHTESGDIRWATEEALLAELKAAARAMENFIGNWLVDGLMTAMLERLNQAELNLIDWMNTWWFYDMYPAMQDMVKQYGVASADRARQQQAGSDVQAGNDVRQQRQTIDRQAAHTLMPAENACPVATAVGGQQRALIIGTAMRKGYQDEMLARGLGRVGTPGASAQATAELLRADKFQTLFCDPEGNSGNNDCRGSDPRFYNADTQVTSRLYNQLTLDVTGLGSQKEAEAAATPPATPPAPGDPPAPPKPDADLGQKNADTLTAMLENMLGSTAMDPLDRDELMTAQGRERFLNRRAYLARMAAAGAAPHMLMGWRMPGSQLGPWISDLRKAAGVNTDEISPNPSYREVMHALAVDRFNSGSYGVGKITDETAIQREKLIQQTLYLMQLRDYYELLERTALSLAVQISIMADERPLPDIVKLQPTGG